MQLHNAYGKSNIKLCHHFHSLHFDNEFNRKWIYNNNKTEKGLAFFFWGDFQSLFNMTMYIFALM